MALPCSLQKGADLLLPTDGPCRGWKSETVLVEVLLDIVSCKNKSVLNRDATAERAGTAANSRIRQVCIRCSSRSMTVAMQSALADCQSTFAC